MPTIKSLIYHIVLIDCVDTKKYTIGNQYFLLTWYLIGFVANSLFIVV